MEEEKEAVHLAPWEWEPVVTRLGYFEFQVACSLIRGDGSELTVALVALLWISPFLFVVTSY